MSPFERRILAYLDQRGGSAPRRSMVIDLAPPDSKLVRCENGSNAGIPRLAAAWTRRLVAAGLVTFDRNEWRIERYKITAAGRAALREDVPR